MCLFVGLFVCERERECVCVCVYERERVSKYFEVWTNFEWNNFKLIITKQSGNFDELPGPRQSKFKLSGRKGSLV